ncbi:MAG: hypothetical protein QXR45_16555 [Candidatus Bathyarchaeia archaeon]
MRLKKVAPIVAVITLISLTSIMLCNSINANPEEYTIYYQNVAYPNLKSCHATPGNGVWTTPIKDSFCEIGVLEITETREVYRVEFYGSGCVYPVTLTCNGISKEVHYYHDYDPYGRYGNELIIFEITPSKIITAYTGCHDMPYNHGFRIEWIKVYYIPKIPATINIDPDTLNLRSKGKWITVYVEFPEDYNVSDIDVSSILLNGSIPAESKPVAIGDYDSDGIPDLMVKFKRAQVISYILANVNLTELYEERFMTITLTITGKLKDGTSFQGSDIIRIVMPMLRKLYKIFII